MLPIHPFNGNSMPFQNILFDFSQFPQFLAFDAYWMRETFGQHWFIPPIYQFGLVQYSSLRSSIASNFLETFDWAWLWLKSSFWFVYSNRLNGSLSLPGEHSRWMISMATGQLIVLPTGDQVSQNQHFDSGFIPK